MKKYYLLIIMVLLITTSSCSVLEMPESGSSPSNPLYVNYPVFSVSVNETDVTGWSGLLSDDQHVIDSEVISAIENNTINGLTMSGEIILGSTLDFDTLSSGLYMVSSGLANGFYFANTNTEQFGLNNVWKSYSSSRIDNDYIYREYWRGNNDTHEIDYGRFDVIAADVTDGTEDTKLQWYLKNAGADNLAMYLTGDGTLYIDGTYETFDEYDDAIVLKKGWSKKNMEELCRVGILINISDNTTGNKYLFNMQKTLSILAGGIYQNRDKIDNLTERLKKLEDK